MKVAIVHDYLNDYGGAEKVVNAIHELYPNAPIYTAVKDEKKLHKAGAFLKADIRAPKLNGIIAPLKKLFVFSYPIYFENLDLKEYDLVISSTAHFAKGIVTRSDALHICYIHTPPRFLWGYKTETSIRDKWWAKYPLKVIDSYLRIWDFAAAQRPHYLLTNSENTRRRIQKFYKRDATVIYPFYDSNLNGNEIAEISPCEAFETSSKKSNEYYFTISRKGRYKNLDIIAKAFNKMKKLIFIAGSGSLDPELKRYESDYVKLLGFLTEDEKVSYLKGCKAFVLATENEDFGITPIEAMSFGKPVIALNSGGLVETVIDGKTGVLYNEPTVSSLIQGIDDYELRKKNFSSTEIEAFASKFSKDRFKKEFKNFIKNKIQETSDKKQTN